MKSSGSQYNTEVRLSSRLQEAHHRYFVGRSAEIALFRSALQEEIPPFAVLHLYGTGGVGKTTLLREYTHLAVQAGITVFTLDGRHVDPSPAGFLRALRLVMNLSEDSSPVVALAGQDRIVLLIDTYEMLSPLDGWLREEFLPKLPGHVLVVLAGRNQPAAPWRTHLDWQAVTRIVPLRNLRPEESKCFLTLQGVPPMQHSAVLGFTHGHPLALSLVADVVKHQETPTPFILEQQPDVIRVLLNCFLQNVPSAKHRQALHICAHVRVVTEALLVSVMEEKDAELFEWLRSLSFIEQSTQGIFPHDLVRDILDTDLRWRNPEEYRRLHQKARNYYIRLMQLTTGTEQQGMFASMMYLHRNNPFMKTYFDYSTLGTAYAEPASPDYFPVIFEMVRKYEGEEAAHLLQYWMERQPQAFILFRGREGEPIGFTTFIALHQLTPEDLATDPGVNTVWNFMQRYGPLREGEEAFYMRFWSGKDTYQLTSAASDLLHVIGGTRIFSNQKLAWAFTACADKNYWLPMFAYINFHYSPETDFVVGEKKYAVFHHDWRAQPLLPWMEQMLERELATGFQPEQQAKLPAPLIVLSQPEFTQAVREALHHYHRQPELSRNPLLQSRLITDMAGDKPGITDLQAVIREAVESLSVHPKDEKLYRALYRTYIKSSLTQEDAAECLNLPFSTYRYHLANGIKRITEWLWHRELYGAEV